MVWSPLKWRFKFMTHFPSQDQFLRNTTLLRLFGTSTTEKVITWIYSMRLRLEYFFSMDLMSVCSTVTGKMNANIIICKRFVIITVHPVGNLCIIYAFPMNFDTFIHHSAFLSRWSFLCPFVHFHSIILFFTFLCKYKICIFHCNRKVQCIKCLNRI